MARVRRKGFASYQKALEANGGNPDFEHPFDPARPWNYVWSEIMADAEKSWWHVELEHPALVILATRTGVSNVLGGDAPISPVAPAPSPPGISNATPIISDTQGFTGSQRYTGGGKGGGGGGGRRQNDWAWEPAPKQRKTQHNIVDGKYVTNRSGIPLCKGFNEGACLASRGNRCTANPSTVHQCERCLENHCGLRCPHPELTGPSSNVVRTGKGNGEQAKGWGKGSNNNNWWGPKGKGKSKGYGKGKKGSGKYGYWAY